MVFSLTQRILLWLSSLTAAVSGILLTIMKYSLKPENEFSVINHPWQNVILKLHILFSVFFVFVCGMVLISHFLPKLRSKQKTGRRSGWVLLILLFELITGGFFIPVITQETILFYLIWSHIIGGFGFYLFFWIHQICVAWHGLSKLIFFFLIAKTPLLILLFR